MLANFLVPAAFIWCTSFKRGCSSMMKAAQFVPGGPEGLSTAQVPRPVLKEREVLVHTMASAINRADTLQRRGLYPAPPGESLILGLEAAGVITEKHGTCAGSSKEGDRVMALLGGGGNAEYVAIAEDHLMPIPPSFSFSKAAAVPEVWLTAYQLLTFVGSMREGSRVLIHAGASGVGTAAVQLVQLLGGTAIVTAGSQEKVDFCISLGAVGGANYKNGPFTEEVLRLTEGRGVDIILDCVGGSYWEQNLASIATDGEWILYGLMGGSKVEGDILARILRKRVSLKGTTLRARSKEYKTELIQSFSKRVLGPMESGTVKPIIHTTFPLDRIADAHTLMETNTTIGKIVLDHSAGDEKAREDL